MLKPFVSWLAFVGGNKISGAKVARPSHLQVINLGRYHLTVEPAQRSVVAYTLPGQFYRRQGKRICGPAKGHHA